MIATVEIPISWIGPVILTITPAIPPIILIAGIALVWKSGNDHEFQGSAIIGAWLAIMGALGCLVEIFHYGVVRFV